MKLPRAVPIAFDLLGLAWDISKAIVRIAVPKKQTRAEHSMPLTHADSERQADAARIAGPRCDARRGSAVCIMVRGHAGPHWFSDREAGG